LSSAFGVLIRLQYNRRFSCSCPLALKIQVHA
jgi:hypothetical protein